ncbi:MAG: polysaccharide ABC transporter ATP-binding protein [Armatimonadota bacterium]|nr:polysaccharide ABC transporter ATP-binding protein [Armatimonadota bacterium]
MQSDVLVSVEHVSKKYCKSIKRSMAYAVTDITRNLLRMSSKPDRLRPAEFWAVDDVSFEMRRGESVGLVGPNGSGKTTLLQLINGIFWPDKGKVTVRGRVGALIAVGAGFHPMLTGRENIFVNAAILGMTKEEVQKKFDAIVEFADIGDFLDTPVKYYSSGMFVRLGFAVAAHCEPDILLVDEVLAVGDAKFQRKCLNRLTELRKQGVSFILVSHNMQSVEGVATRGLALRQGKVVYEGDVREAIAKYELMMLREGAEIDGFARPVQDDPECLVLVKKYPGYGTDEIRVDRMYVLDASGVPKKLFRSEDSLTVAATITSDVRDSVRLLVNFINERGLICLGTTQVVDVEPGQWRILLRFEPIQLSTGRYKLTFHVFDSSFTNPYSNGHYGWFEVEKRHAVNVPGVNSPLCWAEPKVTVLSAEDETRND